MTLAGCKQKRHSVVAHPPRKSRTELPGLIDVAEYQRWEYIPNEELPFRGTYPVGPLE